MCTKRLFNGPLVCLEKDREENDGHSHHYASLTGSWHARGDKESEHG